jgi:putative ABC transport system substrate-binding protein
MAGHAVGSTGLLLMGGCDSAASGPGRSAHVRHIGYLAHDAGPAGNPYVGAFQQGLHELGLIEGRNIVMEYGFAAGKVERLPDLAAELVGRKVDVIVATQDQATHVARTTTSTIPIVTVASSDPVGTGLIASLGRPGGRITGLTRMSAELSAKRLELLREVMPGVSRVAVLWNATSADKAREFSATQSAARQWGMQLQSLAVHHAEAFWAAFQEATMVRSEVLVTLLDHLTFEHRELVGFLASQAQLPAIFEVRECVEAGGLMAYGPNLLALYRRAAAYVYKLLQGAKPDDLPVERPTRFELVINLRTVQTLGLALPRSVLLLADELIQ